MNRIIGDWTKVLWKSFRNCYILSRDIDHVNTVIQLIISLASNTVAADFGPFIVFGLWIVGQHK